jgi:WD40 repeat protein
LHQYQVSRRRLVPSVANLEELIATAAKPGGELKLWDVTTGREVSTLWRGIRPIGGLARSSDGRRPSLTELLDLSGPVAVWVWDAATARELLILRGHTDGVRDTVSPDGKRIARASTDRTIELWDAGAAATGIAAARTSKTQSEQDRIGHSSIKKAWVQVQAQAQKTRGLSHVGAARVR